MEETVELPSSKDADLSNCNARRIRRSLLHQNNVPYYMDEIRSGEESESEMSIKDNTFKSLQKGNERRRCSGGSFLQRKPPRWCPEEACTPAIDEAPVFYPSEEEFKDTLRYIKSIHQKAEQYGICRIIPPPSWKPPCPLKENCIWHSLKFTTRVQQIEKLQNREPMKKKPRNCCHRKRKRRRGLRFGMTRRRNVSDFTEVNDCGASDTDKKFGFQSGCDFTLEAFEKYADDFAKQYFGSRSVDEVLDSCNYESARWKPSVEEIEGEYWRIVEKSSKKVEVHYGADLETRGFGSGFPNRKHLYIDELSGYLVSGWNLNNLPRLPGSILSYETEDISGVLVPWLYVGMCFSSFCWHVEDHHLYSLNYMHFGDPKLWYGVPGSHAVKLEDAMKKHLPGLFAEHPFLLNDLVTQLSPAVLKSEGVPVYRAVQNAGEFVLTFPRAYHAGFNCGFNCAEAVNVAPLDWLPHGQCAVELYSEQRRRTSISHDKLLLCAACEVVKSLSNPSLYGSYGSICAKDGVLTKAIKERIRLEKERRENLPRNYEARKMDKDFDSKIEKECAYCFYDLHLSAAGCECTPDKFSCLNHANILCACEQGKRFFLFRYELDELSVLIEALEGNTSAIHHWLQIDQGIVPDSNATCLEKLVDFKLTTDVPEDCRGEMACASQGALTDINFADVKDDSGGQSGETNGLVHSKSFINHLSYSPKDNRLFKPEHDVLEAFKLHDKLHADNPCIETVLTDISCTEISVDPPHSINLKISSNSDKIMLTDQLCHSDPSLTSDYKNIQETSVTSPSIDVKISSNIGIYCQEIQSYDTSQSRDVKQVSSENVEFFFWSSSSIELIDLGTVTPTKGWCNSRAIFPRGFRSRVKFFSIDDPKSTCSYISEVLDGGDLGPLFRVTVEGRPNEGFTFTSADQCWGAVQERLNQKIRSLQCQGKQDLPLMQNPGSIDGLQMFGFLSPTIVQAIETLDPYHHCIDYWSTKTL